MIQDCDKCGGRAHVTDSRPLDNGKRIRRRRHCNCGHKWTTYEVSESELDGMENNHIGRIMLGQLREHLLRLASQIEKAIEP